MREAVEEELCLPCEEHDEVMRAKPIKGPYEPTAEEIERHRISHLPYRSWCPECVGGKGHSVAHKQQDNERMATVETRSTDYMFLGDEETTLPILASRWHKSRWTVSKTVPKKGPDEYAVKAETEDVRGQARRNSYIRVTKKHFCCHSKRR